MDILKTYIKKIDHPKYLPWFALGAGVVGLLLRAWLFSTREETTELLAADHPAKVLLWILTAVVVAVVLWGTRNLKEAAKYSFNFPASLQGAIGCVFAALSMGITAVAEWIVYQDRLTVIASVLGVLSAAALLFLAYNRYKGQRQSILYHGIVCLCLMFRLVSQYRHWSADPQLMDYSFQLLATVCLMLSCYQNAAFDADTGNRKLHTIFRLGAVYFCCVSLLGSENVMFYLGCAVWMISNFCSLIPMRKQEEL